MPVGGKRPGAGRKPGAAWASKKPAPIRDMAKARVREVLTTAQDPLSVLVEIAADVEQDVQLRVQAATAACPFMFPRLSAAVVATAPATARDDTQGLVERLMQRFARLAPPVQTIEGTASPAAAE
jgi:proline dehydrogenase